MGNFMNAEVIATEMYRNFKPSAYDILVILYGAHAYREELATFREFMRSVYTEVAVASTRPTV